MFCGGAGGGFGGAGFSAISFRKDETKSSGSCGGGASENFERLGGGASAMAAAARAAVLSLVVDGVWITAALGAPWLAAMLAAVINGASALTRYAEQALRTSSGAKRGQK